MLKHPLLLEINTRQLIRRASALLGHQATLGSIPDQLIKEWQAAGFAAVWLMGIWTTGPAGRVAAISHQGQKDEYAFVLPDWTAGDVVGSPYAIQEYKVHPDFGGNKALLRLRQRLSDRGIAIILDFVPNHLALDHAWIKAHPGYFVRAAENKEPREGYFHSGATLFAHGRDPNFPPWIDTVQVDYRNSLTKHAMIGVLCSIATLCDGVRCDMAMLVLSDVFQRTWGKRPEMEPDQKEFWASAIDAVRTEHPDFTFIAESYWGLEERLQLLGFDYTYHKPLYDVLVHGKALDIWKQLQQTEFLSRSLFFVENHDEPRIATAIPDAHRRHAAAMIVLTLPGARLVHDGQTEGKTTRHPIQLAREREERIDSEELSFYRSLFAAFKESAIGKGTWHLLDTKTTDWNPKNAAAVFAFLWETPEGQRDLVIVNDMPQESEARILIRFQGVAGRPWKLRGRLSGKQFAREGDELCGEGLYVRLAPYEAEIFQLTSSLQKVKC